MPNPKTLKLGDRVRFISIPEEWRDPGFQTWPCDRRFLQAMIKRTWPSRVCEVDAWGYPWIHARMRRRGRIEHHWWCISESTGWRKVAKRS